MHGPSGALSWHPPSRCPIFSELILPPGYACRIDINPDAAPYAVTVTVTVFYGGRGDMTFAERWWVGEITTSLTLLDAPGALQKILDGLTKRGVRAMPETR